MSRRWRLLANNRSVTVVTLGHGKDINHWVKGTSLCGGLAVMLSFTAGCDVEELEGFDDAQRSEFTEPIETDEPATALPSGAEDFTAEDVPQCVRDRTCVQEDTPEVEIPLPSGNAVRFYTYDDESVGVLEGGPSAAVLVARPEYVDLSPLELYWGLTRDGDDVPPGLIAQQAHLVTREGALAAEQVQTTTRGWIMDEINDLAAVNDPQEWVDCSNSWGSNYCGQGGIYNSGACYYGTTSHKTYAKSGTNRYRTFHCQQQGFQWGSVDYITQNSSCGNTGTWTIVWDTYFCESTDYLGTWCEDQWRAATWTWYPGNSNSRRRWYATTNWNWASANTNYDWGNKARFMGC